MTRHYFMRSQNWRTRCTPRSCRAALAARGIAANSADPGAARTRIRKGFFSAAVREDGGAGGRDPGAAGRKPGSLRHHRRVLVELQNFPRQRSAAGRRAGAAPLGCFAGNSRSDVAAAAQLCSGPLNPKAAAVATGRYPTAPAFRRGAERVYHLRHMPRREALPAPHNACTCGSLRKASRRISQFYDCALAPVGIKSTQFSILAEVERGSVAGPLTMCELATAMVMDRSTLGHNLRPLERDDCCSVCSSPCADRRKRYVALTKKGKATLQRARRLWRTAEGRFEKIFGKRHAADLRAVLLNIAGNDELNSLPLR